MVAISLEPGDLPALSLLANAPGDESIGNAHRHHSGGISEQILFERLNGRREAVASIKRLALFDLIDRKRGGWLKISGTGMSFVMGEGAVPAHCFMFGGKPLGFSAETVTRVQLTLAAVDESPVEPIHEVNPDGTLVQYEE